MTIKNPNKPSSADLTQSLLNISVEFWRFSKLFDRLLTKLDAGEQSRYRGQFQWFQKKMEESLNIAQLNIVNVEGIPYDSGMAATPLNIDEFEPQDKLVVEQMLEPIIMGPDGIVKTGTVVLRKVQS